MRTLRSRTIDSQSVIEPVNEVKPKKKSKAKKKSEAKTISDTLLKEIQNGHLLESPIIKEISRVSSGKKKNRRKRRMRASDKRSVKQSDIEEINGCIDQPCSLSDDLSNVTNDEEKTLIRTDTFIKSKPKSPDINKTVTSVLNETFTTFTPSTKRKKWQKYERNSINANLILENVKNIEKFNHPSKTLEKSTTKLKLKTVMPNFALIHQKTFEKMESVLDYSNRKKARAEMLLSNKKSMKDNVIEGICSKQLFSEHNEVKFEPKISKSTHKIMNSITKIENTENTKIPKFRVHNSPKIKQKKAIMNEDKPLEKQSTNITFNKFGFKTRDSTKKMESVKHFGSHLPVKNSNTTLPVTGKSVKCSIFTRPDLVATANRMKVQNGETIRNKSRDVLKGVRTNRRFELLMQMRNK